MTNQENVIVEVPVAWFKLFVMWLSRVRICDVPPTYVVAVHRVYGCFEESYEEFYGDQLDLFKENRE